MRRAEVYFLELFTFACLFVALIAVSLIRIDMTDTPWHLATAKYAFAEGTFLTRNHFSYTYPDYPIFQQYPVYQILLYLIFEAFGWKGLSIFHCAAWVVIYLLWLKWAKPTSRQTTALSLAWLLGLLGFQRRMILRPDIISLFLLLLMLLVFDSYRKGKTYAAVAIVVIQFFFVNSHQLFPIGIGFQIVFLAHLFLVKNFGGRYGIAEVDATVPLLPLLLALGSSISACFLSPLGTNIVDVVSHTIGSLRHHKDHVLEFKPFFSDSYSLLLAIFSTCLGAVGVYRNRKVWQPFEVGLWILAAFILSAAIRGIAFYTMICVGLFGRSFTGVQFAGKEIQGKDQSGEIILRTFCSLLTLAIIVGIFYIKWVVPTRVLGGTQPGIGLAHGVWPYETIKFLKNHPPTGEMINLTWYSGNPLILELFPRHRVFVDPRFESYPRDFLLKAIEAGNSRQVLEELISEFQPDWMVLEIGRGSICKLAAELIKENAWVLVHADTVLLTLVRNLPKNDSYIAAHRLDPKDIAPQDFLDSETDLKALQALRMAGLYMAFGLKKKAEEMIWNAELVADRYVNVRSALNEFRKNNQR
jgi:hypothetical protein